MSNPCVEHHGKIQIMTLLDGHPKGLMTVLKECGFYTQKLMHAKCSLVCPMESQNCCMACVLSQQDNVKSQSLMLETLIKEAGHECLFLPKFHCELNMVCSLSLNSFLL